MNTRTRPRRRTVASVLAALAAVPTAIVLTAPAAQAATVTVACGGDSGDVPAIQSAVNGAGNGDTIELSGTCDFSIVGPAGGDQVASIATAAVLIRPSTTPINGLTIKSAGAPQSAIIQGSGDEAAFAIGPGNKNVTIKGLQFQNLGVAVAVLNDADGAMVGSNDGAMPSINANRILGTAGATAGVKVFASPIDGDGESLSAFGVRYGIGVLPPAWNFGSQAGKSLENVTVAGNYISFDPPGSGDTAHPLSVVGVDVRDRGYARIDGLNITGNAIGMATPAPAYYGMRGISLHSHCCADDGDKDTLNSGLLPADYSPANPQNQYFTRNVTITGNNLGRFEEIEDALDDIDPALANTAADFQSTGRSGITLLGVGSFTVAGNGVRTLGHGTAVPMPTGGIVASDSGYGDISGNGVISVVDDSVGNADLGAIAVIDDASALLGDVGHEQHTENVLVKDNIVGPVTTDVPGAVWARRGILVDAADRVTVTGNNVKGTTADALNVAVPVVGPGGPSNPNTGQAPLPARVRDSVFCNNILDGAVDNAAEVTYGNVAGNSGNGLPTPVGATNAGCVVTQTINDEYLDQNDALVVSGRAWGNRPVTVTLQDQTAATLVKTPTSGVDGSFTATFTTAELTTLSDGVMAVRSSASSIPSAYASTTAYAFFGKDTANNPLIPGTAQFRGNGDGRLNAAELSPLVLQWQAGDPTATKVNSKLLVNGIVPTPVCEGQDVPVATGEASPLAACMTAVNAAADGATITVEMSWEDDFGNASPLVLVNAVKDAAFGATVDIQSVTYDSNGQATVSGVVNGTRTEVMGGVFLAVQEPSRLLGFMPGRTASTTTTFNPTSGAFSAVLNTGAMHDGDLLFGARVVDVAQNQAVDSFTSDKDTGELLPVALAEDVVDFLS